MALTHQSLDHPDGVENQADVRTVPKAGRVLAVFSGHHHENYARAIDGVPHVQVNSASYYWVGEKFAHASYDAETHKRCPSLKHTCPYRDPLWAVVTIDLGRGVLTVEGRSTEWVGGSPWAVGATEATHGPKTIQPAVSPRTIPLG